MLRHDGEPVFMFSADVMMKSDLWFLRNYVMTPKRSVRFFTMMNVILTSIRLPILESCQNSRAQPRLATRSFYEMNLRVLAGLMTSTWLAISAEFSMFVLTSTYSLPLCKPFKLVVWSAFNSRSRRTCLNRRNVANVRAV